MRSVVLFTFTLSFMYVLTCTASHMHTYIHTPVNARSALLLSRMGKLELQEPCLSNLSTNFHTGTSVEGMLCSTLPARRISAQQVQCTRLTTSANRLHTGNATHLAIAHTHWICTWAVATAPYACKIPFVFLICSQTLSTFTQIHIIWHSWGFWDHTNPGHFPRAMLIHIRSL